MNVDVWSLSNTWQRRSWIETSRARLIASSHPASPSEFWSLRANLRLPFPLRLSCCKSEKTGVHLTRIMNNSADAYNSSTNGSSKSLANSLWFHTPATGVNRVPLRFYAMPWMQSCFFVWNPVDGAVLCTQSTCEDTITCLFLQGNSNLLDNLKQSTWLVWML